MWKVRFTIDLHITYFLQYASEQIGNLKQALKQLEEVQSSLSEFFCEDKSTFKIDECFKQFAAFTSALKQVWQENKVKFSDDGGVRMQKKGLRIKNWQQILALVYSNLQSKFRRRRRTV